MYVAEVKRSLTGFSDYYWADTHIQYIFVIVVHNS